jgi:hypothetical protein
MKWSLCLLFSLTVIVLIIFKRYDGFGMSPGTPVQLRTSHVPTQEDAYYWKNVYPKIVRKEIYNLTESDLHLTHQ